MRWLTLTPQPTTWVTREALTDTTGLTPRNLTYWTSESVIPPGIRTGVANAEYPVEAIDLIGVLISAREAGHKSLATLRVLTEAWFDKDVAVIAALSGQR